MGRVAKYNLYKGVSLLLTFGTPIVTLLCSGEFFVHKEGASVSAAGVFVLLIMLCIFKDKIVENFKLPSAFVISAVVLVLLWLIESIIKPIKLICILTMCATGIDEFTFKNWYKRIERILPDDVSNYKHVGFIFAKSKNIKGGDTNA